MPEEQQLIEELQETPEEQQELREAEAPAEQTQQPEQPEQQATQPEQPTQKLVPLQALQEARWEHRQLREQTAAEIAQLKQKLAFADELKAQIEALRQPQVPKYDEDPLGNLQQRLTQSEQRALMLEQYLQQRVQAETQMTQQQQALSQLASYVAQSEVEYSKAVSDYREAVQYLEERERARASATGLEPHELDEYIRQKKLALIGEATRRNLNPADVAYKMAIADGWQQRQGQQQPSILDTVVQGQKAARTLSGSGKTDPATPSIEKLVKLEGDEFDREWDKLFGSR